MCTSHRNVVSQDKDGTAAGCTFQCVPVRDPEHELLAQGGILPHAIEACKHCDRTVDGRSITEQLAVMNRTRDKQDTTRIAHALHLGQTPPERRKPLRLLDALEEQLYQQERDRRRAQKQERDRKEKEALEVSRQATEEVRTRTEPRHRGDALFPRLEPLRLQAKDRGR